MEQAICQNKGSVKKNGDFENISPESMAALKQAVCGYESLFHQPLECEGSSSNLRSLPETGFIVVKGDANIGKPSSKFDGTIVVSGQLHLFGGHYEGAIYASGTVVVHQKSYISGSLYAMQGISGLSTSEIVFDGRLWLPGEAAVNNIIPFFPNKPFRILRNTAVINTAVQYV